MGSPVEGRKDVTYIGDGLIPGTKKRNTLGITTEASIGRGRSTLLAVIFPVLAIGYASDLPPRLNHTKFCTVIREIIARADMQALGGGKRCKFIDELCRGLQLLPDYGVRSHPFTLRKVPYLILFDHTDPIFARP